MMVSLSEQLEAVNFCFLLVKNATETVLILKTAYKDMEKTRVHEFIRFKNSDISINDKRHSECWKNSICAYRPVY